MPNHVINRVLVTGPDSQIKVFIKKCFRILDEVADGPDIDFESVLPTMTPEVSPSEDIIKNDNIRKTVWGTKWSAWDTTDRMRLPGVYDFVFITASDYPEPVYRALGRAFPSLHFDITAFEGGSFWATSGQVKGDRVEFDDNFDPKKAYEIVFEESFDEALRRQVI